MRPLTDDEVARLVAALKPRDKALFILGHRTGYRISELLSLKLKDVFNGPEIARFVTVARKAMKGKISSRTVPLHEEARAALSAYIGELRLDSPEIPDQPLFPSREGGSLSRKQAWTILTTAARRLGIYGRIGTHGMRKTFAARIYEKLKHDLLGTQKALGHKSMNSTTSYLSFADEDVSAAILED